LATPRIAVLVAVLACAILGAGLVVSTSPTYDEPVHLSAGYTDLVHGRYRLNAMDHPPLGEMWAAVPLLFLRLDRFAAHPAWIDAQVYHFGDVFLYHNRVPASMMLAAARGWALGTWTLLVAALLVSWAFEEGGAAAAWGAAGALGFCVPWFSNAALITTDAPSAALFFAAFALLAQRRRSLTVWLAAGVAVGAALAAKFNMILLPPLLAVALGVERRADRSRAAPWVALAAAVAAAALTLAAAYRFGFIDLYFRGVTATLSRLSEGRGAYLLGRHSTTGWFWYFPTAVAVKTPLALLLLGAIGARAAWRRPPARAVWILIPPALYFAAAMTSKTQIGYRHILPVYPFLCLWAGLGAGELWSRGRSGRAVAGILGTWLALSAVFASSHPLSYFNEIARGRGADWLSDSNLDWGQDLPALAAELKARGGPTVVLCYFGSGDPDAYGIRYVPLAIVSNVERPGNARLQPGEPVLFAISQTNRVGTYYRDPALFGWLTSRRPTALGGGSIALYDLTADADGRAHLAALLGGSRPEDAAVVRGAAK
jgi:hypothetical protein